MFLIKTKSTLVNWSSFLKKDMHRHEELKELISSPLCQYRNYRISEQKDQPKLIYREKRDRKRAEERKKKWIEPTFKPQLDLRVISRAA